MPQIGIQHLAANCTKVWLAVPEGRACILFSYSTPVALWVFGETTRRYYVNPAPTVTTRKHLGQHGPLPDLRPGDHCEHVTEDAMGRLIDQTTSGGEQG